MTDDHDNNQQGPSHHLTCQVPFASCLIHVHSFDTMPTDKVLRRRVSRPLTSNETFYDGTSVLSSQSKRRKRRKQRNLRRWHCLRGFIPFSRQSTDTFIVAILVTSVLVVISTLTLLLWRTTSTSSKALTRHLELQREPHSTMTLSSSHSLRGPPSSAMTTVWTTLQIVLDQEVSTWDHSASLSTLVVPRPPPLLPTYTSSDSADDPDYNDLDLHLYPPAHPSWDASSSSERHDDDRYDTPNQHKFHHSDHEYDFSDTIWSRRRRIDVQAELLYWEHDIPWLLDDMDVEPDGLDRRHQNNEDYVLEHSCRRTSWQSQRYPICNTMHETSANLERPLTDLLQNFGNITYRGHGAFRDSWHFSYPATRTTDNQHDDLIWKTLRYQDDLEFNLDYFYQIHKEAIIMEQLTASNRIVDIYGFCGTSVMAEHMSQEVSQDIVPGYQWGVNEYAGYMAQQELDKLQVNDVHPMNNLTLDEKLNLAIVMAESIADIHGYVGGVIVHGDIHPVQWLANDNGQVKLNDFNNAEILEFWDESNDYCPIYRCYGGTFRAPEEFRCIDSDQGIDVYAMGNTLYCLLTGLWPFYEFDPDNDESKIQNLLIDNLQRPFVDDRYRHRCRVEAGMVQIMEDCWEWDPAQRLSIFDVVQQLYQLRDTTIRKER